MTNFRNIYSSDLSHRARSVYMYLKDRADKDDKCWPAIKTIAKELGLSSSTVKRALDELCQAGLLTKESRWRENGGRTSNLYNHTGQCPGHYRFMVSQPEVPTLRFF